MRARLLLAFAAAASLTMSGAGQDAKKSELEGNWKGDSLEKAGQQLDEHAKTVRWEIAGDKITVLEGDLRVQGTITVDSKKSPKTIDVEAKGDGGRISLVLIGIYALEGDVLKVCYASTKDAKRPKEFKTSPGSDQVLLVLKRQKSQGRSLGVPRESVQGRRDRTWN
jgi:uncharacterized protein (TIGR03067 family)